MYIQSISIQQGYQRSLCVQKCNNNDIFKLVFIDVENRQANLWDAQFKRIVGIVTF